MAVPTTSMLTPEEAYKTRFATFNELVENSRLPRCTLRKIINGDPEHDLRDLTAIIFAEDIGVDLWRIKFKNDVCNTGGIPVVLIDRLKPTRNKSSVKMDICPDCFLEKIADAPHECF